MRGAYEEAKHYAFKLDPVNYRDNLHDAYLLWWNKSNSNLFDQHRGVVSAFVRNVTRQRRNTNLSWNVRKQRLPSKFYFEFQKVHRSFVQIATDDGQTGYAPITTWTPEQELIYKDLVEHFSGLLTPAQLKVFRLMLRGHSGKVISKRTGMSVAAVSAKAVIVKKKLREWL